MVKSGLENFPDEEKKQASVSPYRLTIHFGMAIALYMTVLSTYFKLVNHMNHNSKNLSFGLRMQNNTILLLLISTGLIGSFVAGNRAGKIYNSWPKMGLNWIPNDIWLTELGYDNLFKNPTTIQFIHRTIATATLILGIWHSKIIYYAYITKGIKKSAILFSTFLGIQFVAGIATLLFNCTASMGCLHQAGFLATIGTFLKLRYKIYSFI